LGKSCFLLFFFLDGVAGDRGLGTHWKGWSRSGISFELRLIGNRDKAKLLTKGDNNVADDTELYARGQDYLERKDIIGSVVAYIPFVGYVTILLSEHPWLKTVMLGIMGLVVVLQRE
jgi:hypothetical protein